MGNDPEVLGNLLSLLQWDSALWLQLWLALRVAFTSALVAALIGLPLGGVLAVKRFPAKQRLLSIITRMMGWPLVLLALTIYMLLVYRQPGGLSALLYHPATLIFVQAVFILPVIITLSLENVSFEWRRLKPQFSLWRMNAQQALPTLYWKTRVRLVVVSIVALSRAMTEIGLVFLLAVAVSHLISTGNLLENPSLLILSGLLLYLASLFIYAMARYFGGERSIYWRLPETNIKQKHISL